MSMLKVGDSMGQKKLEFSKKSKTEDNCKEVSF